MAKKPTRKSTPKKERDRYADFIAALMEYGNVSQAARHAGLDRSGVYAKRREDESFAAVWDDALAIGVEALEDEAKRRAYEGWLEPIWHKGEQCGEVRKFSDTLLIVLLKAHKPEKYAERKQVSGPDGGPVQYEGNVSLPESVQELIKKVSGQ
ncbi:hypothetical protein LJC46_04300 [Desulfovibrio sp. OttesenSCG-928-G15]|nr:hypothetical protein [Desulfovibrio sp. OttesenSCG-928-G15]